MNLIRLWDAMLLSMQPNRFSHHVALNVELLVEQNQKMPLIVTYADCALLLFDAHCVCCVSRLICCNINNNKEIFLSHTLLGSSSTKCHLKTRNHHYNCRRGFSIENMGYFYDDDGERSLSNSHPELFFFSLLPSSIANNVFAHNFACNGNENPTADENRYALNFYKWLRAYSAHICCDRFNYALIHCSHQLSIHRYHFITHWEFWEW